MRRVEGLRGLDPKGASNKMRNSALLPVLCVCGFPFGDFSQERSVKIPSFLLMILSSLYLITAMLATIPMKTLLLDY